MIWNLSKYIINYDKFVINSSESKMQMSRPNIGFGVMRKPRGQMRRVGAQMATIFKNSYLGKVSRWFVRTPPFLFQDIQNSRRNYFLITLIFLISSCNAEANISWKVLHPNLFTAKGNYNLRIETKTNEIPEQISSRIGFGTRPILDGKKDTYKNDW